jgi:dihydrofolate reductase
MIKAIFACDDNWGIGKNNSLPWPHNPEDLKWFKEMTDDGIVIMGRNTWESLPVKPLPNRINYVITSDPNISKGYYGRFTSTNLPRAIKAITEYRYNPCPDIWIIGGAQLFESCIPIIEEVHLSRIEGDYDCDVFLPKWKLMRNFNISYEKITKNGLCIQKWVKR